MNFEGEMIEVEENCSQSGTKTQVDKYGMYSRKMCVSCQSDKHIAINITQQIGIQ